MAPSTGGNSKGNFHAEIRQHSACGYWFRPLHPRRLLQGSSKASSTRYASGIAALSLSEIQANINQPLPSGPPDLVARWGLNETGTTTTVLDSTPSPVNGTINGSGWTRVAGAPFNLVFNQAPNMPVLNTADQWRYWQTTSPTLSVNVSDPDPADLLSVSFFGRATNGAPAADFNIVAIPDTQHYVDDLIPNDADGNRALTFTQQTQWIVKTARQ
jgi:hypothetical protein